LLAWCLSDFVANGAKPLATLLRRRGTPYNLGAGGHARFVVAE
jgi:hypothetical protein